MKIFVLFSSMTNVTLMSVASIERSMLAHDTNTVFVLPEAIADIVQHPRMKHLNGTPVYHVIAEPYCNIVYIVFFYFRI